MKKVRIVAALAAVLAAGLPAGANAKPCQKKPPVVKVVQQPKHLATKKNHCRKMCHLPPRNTSAHCPS